MSYESYQTKPVGHIQEAERALAEAENLAAHNIDPGVHVQIALAHVAIAQAQMVGQQRA